MVVAVSVVGRKKGRREEEEEEGSSAVLSPNQTPSMVAYRAYTSVFGRASRACSVGDALGTV